MPFDTGILKKFPNKPGVYLMKNRKGAVLYIGKAKNLKLRVRQ
jgi:excinuclease ABC subunit C